MTRTKSCEMRVGIVDTKVGSSLSSWHCNDLLHVLYSIRLMASHRYWFHPQISMLRFYYQTGHDVTLTRLDARRGSAPRPIFDILIFELWSILWRSIFDSFGDAHRL